VPAMCHLLAEALRGVPHGGHGVEVALEAQGARPAQGVASSYRTGVGYGVWLGLVVAARVAYRIVAPAVWKQHAGLIHADKRASRLRAQHRCAVLAAAAPADEGPAEALLLAAYVAATRTDGGAHAPTRSPHPR